MALLVVQETYTVNPVASSKEERPSPFKGGLFRVSVKLPDNYPAEPPEVRADCGNRVWRQSVVIIMRTCLARLMFHGLFMSTMSQARFKVCACRLPLPHAFGTQILRRSRENRASIF
jgi:hypothetical protein